MRNERGFTLVELLVVLAIMAILIAIVVPNLAGLTGGAQETACEQEFDTVQMAMDVLMTNNSAVSVTAGGPFALTSTSSITYWDYLGADYGATIALRDTTDGTYSWDTTGAITQATCP